MKYLGWILAVIFWVTVLIGMIGIGAKVTVWSKNAIYEVRNYEHK